MTIYAKCTPIIYGIQLDEDGFGGLLSTPGAERGGLARFLTVFGEMSK